MAKPKKIAHAGNAHTVRKSMGQHFLHDQDVIDRIVLSLPQEAEQVLEVGPGPGALTQHLIKGNYTFTCVELDRDKCTHLRATYPSLKLIEADFLKIDPPYTKDFDVIGNFPYNISTQIMFQVLEWRSQVTSLVGMFQKEVALRLTAHHGNKDYGIQSVLLSIYYHTEYLFDVHPHSFDPPPRVMSGVIRIKRREVPLADLDYIKFKTFVKLAFSQRRKTLRNCFKSSQPAEMLVQSIFDKRAEQLSVIEFIDLYDMLNNTDSRN
jgi:16S rRNA (adenine1518-N6/adenine1519-N6)-dimethyltransferase